jgi:hypothetical protein
VGPRRPEAAGRLAGLLFFPLYRGRKDTIVINFLQRIFTSLFLNIYSDISLTLPSSCNPVLFFFHSTLYTVSKFSTAAAPRFANVKSRFGAQNPNFDRKIQTRQQTSSRSPSHPNLLLSPANSQILSDPSKLAGKNAVSVWPIQMQTRRQTPRSRRPIQTPAQSSATRETSSAQP